MEDKIEYVSQVEAARRLGVHPSAIYHALRNGRVEKEGNGKLDWKKTEKNWEARRQNKANESQRKYKKPVIKQEPIDPEEVTKIAGSKTLVEARTETEVYKAKLAQLDFERKAGNLVDASKIKEAMFQMARNARDKILNLPEKLAPEIAAEQDTHKIENMLRKELTEALEELSNGKLSKS